MKKRKIIALIMSALLMCATFAVCCSAAEGAAFNIDTDVLTPVKTALTEFLTVQNIVAVIVAGIGLSLGFVLMWFGYRKVKGMILGAARKGKLGG